MSENDTAVPATAPERPPVEPAAAPAPRPGQGAARALALLALATVAGSIYFGWQQRELARAQEEFGRMQAAQQAGAESLRADMTKQNERLAGLDFRQREHADALAASEQRAADTRAAVEKIFAELKSGRDLLPVEETAFLVRNAQYALHLARDSGTALKALELAEARLKEQGDPKWLPAREAIAKAVGQLRAQAHADLTGISARLRALMARVETLPAVQRGAKTGGDAGTAPSATGWREFLRALWEDLKGLVRIRHVEDKIPLLAPEQRYFLAHNLILMLNGAQWAALRADTATYRGNLDAAGSWIATYYDTTQPAVADAQRELKELSEAPIAAEAPDLAPLLAMLRKGTAGR